MLFKNIPSHPRYEISESGIIRNAKNKKVKSQYISSTGYYMVSFSYGNKSKPQRVHRLLAQTFIPNHENKSDINHKDGNKLNNSLENLEWVNHKENMVHAFSTGLANNTGERNGQNKLTEQDVLRIKQMLSEGVSQYKIAQAIGKVSRSTILGIKMKRLWAHI